MKTQLSNALKKGSNEFDLEDSTVILGYVGSLSHGTFVPSTDPNSIDDKDVMGISIPPMAYYTGLKKFEGKQFWDGEWDIVYYEFRKYMRLLLKSNPNVMALMWLEENDYIKVTEPGKLLIANRNIFVSKKAFKAFSGYATSQLKRMTRIGGDSKSGYLGAKRKGLVEKYGYDTKNASHLIRLLRMGIEYLTEGKLYVKRQDSAELIRIKHGEYSLEKIERMAEDHFKLAQEAYIRSSIPVEPDWDKADKLCQKIVESHLDNLKQGSDRAR